MAKFSSGWISFHTKKFQYFKTIAESSLFLFSIGHLLEKILVVTLSELTEAVYFDNLSGYFNRNKHMYNTPFESAVKGTHARDFTVRFSQLFGIIQ